MSKRFKDAEKFSKGSAVRHKENMREDEMGRLSIDEIRKRNEAGATYGEPVTAREDQPQLGTCEFICTPHLKDSGSGPCLHWRPIAEDQPPLNAGSPKDGMQFWWSKWWWEYCENDMSDVPTMCTADLAQQFAEWFAKQTHEAGGAHPSQDAPQLEMLPEGEHTTHGHPHSYSICSEGGDGHKCIALAFGETDEEAASRARQIIAGYYGGSTPSPDPPTTKGSVR